MTNLTLFVTVFERSEDKRQNEKYELFYSFAQDSYHRQLVETLSGQGFKVAYENHVEVELGFINDTAAIIRESLAISNEAGILDKESLDELLNPPENEFVDAA